MIFRIIVLVKIFKFLKMRCKEIFEDVLYDFYVYKL